MTSAPGWYPDPRGSSGSAYWDGSRWLFETDDDRQQPTESESDESASDREWEIAKRTALAILTAEDGAKFEVLRRVLEDVADSTDDPIDQLTGQLTKVTNVLLSMTFIAAALAGKVAELSEADYEDVIEGVERLIDRRDD